MSMQSRLFLRLMLLTVALVVTPNRARAAKNTDEAPEEAAPRVGEGQTQRTLAERIPSVTHRAFSKWHRVELLPLVGLSLNDPFYRYISPGVAVNYYILESLAVGASGEYYAGVATPIEDVGGASTLQFPTFNKPRFAARLQVSWAPLYGKVSWLAEKVMHFDTYVAVSGGLVSPQQGSMSLAGSLAVGQHYFMNNWMALRLEFRDELFPMIRDPAKNKKLDVQILLSASLGVCFYFPQEASEE